MSAESTAALSARAASLHPWDPKSQALNGWLNQFGFPLGLHPLDETQAEQGWLWLDATGQALAALRWRLQPSMQNPRFSFHVGCMVHGSREIKLFQTHKTLQLGNDHTGQAELLELGHAPGLSEPRAVQAMAALMAASLEHLRAQPGSPSSWMTIELPGWRDAQGQSPFWAGLGAKLCELDPAQAEQRVGERWTSELAALMPKTTIYLSLLGLGLRASVGRMGESASSHAAALRLAGFVSSQHVRIDDGGAIWMKALS